MSANFRDVVIAMANERPNMRVSTVVALALAIEGNAKPSNLNDAAALGRWAARQPSVAVFIAADKKIHAIKEVRTLTGASLLQAKNAIEAIR